jgi:hypothetical protein
MTSEKSPMHNNIWSNAPNLTGLMLEEIIVSAYFLEQIRCDEKVPFKHLNKNCALILKL